MSVCLCTLAIHAPYRERARRLCADAPKLPWLVLTDQPSDFADLSVRAVAHAPTGPMAIDYLERIRPTGGGRGAAAYHDKRFALSAALRDFDTAIFLDADSRFTSPPSLDIAFSPGLSVIPLVRWSVAEHLASCGTWRMPAFVDLAQQLFGGTDILHSARWCHETCMAVTKDGREDDFFAAWGRCAEFLQSREVFSGEGGVIGLCAAAAGWTVDYQAVSAIAACLQHEGNGPKAT
jgi:hypothetical protein